MKIRVDIEALVPGMCKLGIRKKPTAAGAVVTIGRQKGMRFDNPAW